MNRQQAEAQAIKRRNTDPSGVYIAVLDHGNVWVVKRYSKKL